MDKTAQAVSTANNKLGAYKLRKDTQEKWQELDGEVERRLESIFKPLVPLEPTEENKIMMESQNNKEPAKLYLEELNRNLKLQADYGKMESDRHKFKIISEALMPDSTFQYVRFNQVLGQELVMFDRRVWLAVLISAIKQCRHGTNSYFITCTEMHVFDIKNKGKLVKHVQIDASMGRTWPLQTNVLPWKDNIYYWKREQTFEDKDHTDGFRRVKNSVRQLTRLNLTDLKETKVDGYKIDEGVEYLSVQFLDYHCSNYIIYAYQTGTSDLQIRRYQDITEARKSAQKLIYQLYSDVCLVDVKKGERIWLTKDPQEKSLKVAREQGILEPECQRHHCNHSQKEIVRVGDCNAKGECEKRFLSQQFVATYAIKYRDQRGYKQAALFAEEKEDQHRKTLHVIRLENMEKPLCDINYEGDLSGVGGCIQRIVEETKDLTKPINLRLNFELFHGKKVSYFRYEPFKKEKGGDREKPRETLFSGMYITNLSVQKIQLDGQSYQFFIDRDGKVVVLFLNRILSSKEQDNNLTIKIEKAIGKEGGEGIIWHKLTSECNRVSTERIWRTWEDFKDQFMGIMNLPNLVVSMPFKYCFIHLQNNDIFITTLQRPKRIASKWERIEGSQDLGELQKFVLSRKKAAVRAQLVVNGKYHRVISELKKVTGCMGSIQSIQVELQQDKDDKNTQFFIETPDGGDYTRVWHGSGHLKGRAQSDTHYCFSFYNNKYHFVVRTNDEIMNCKEGTKIFPKTKDQPCLYLQEYEQGKFRFGDTEEIKDQYDITFETVTEGGFRSDYLPLILNKHQKKEFYLIFYNFSDPEKPLVVQKLLGAGELARVSATYQRTEKTRGTRFMICSPFVPFVLQEYEFIEDITGKTEPILTMTSIRTLIQSPEQSRVLESPQMICIPYFSQYDNQVKGAQLILLNQENGWKGKMAIHIENADEDTSNLQYNGRIFKFGASKVYPDDNTSNDQFFTLVESTIQDSILKDERFDPTEISTMLKTIHASQFNYLPFDMETQVLVDNSKLVQGAFYTPQEVLMSKSKADMYLQNPKSAIDEFNKSQGEFDPFLPPRDHERKYDQSSGDFNLQTLLDRAFLIGTDKIHTIAVKVMFSMQNREDSKYILMKSLPDITTMADPPKELEIFFQSGFTQDEKGYILSIEDPVIDDRAPLESTLQYSEFSIQEYPDLNDLDGLIVDKLKEENERIVEDAEEDDPRYDVQHCSINFTVTILGNKLAALFGTRSDDQDHSKFNNHYLSQIISDLTDSPKLFLGEACMNLIDLQNRNAKLFFRYLFGIYLGGFIAPFLIFQFFDGPSAGPVTHFLQQFMLIVCLIVQTLFFSIECIQLMSSGSFKAYLIDDIWNVQEFFQYIVFCVYFYIEVIKGGIRDPVGESVIETGIAILVLVQAFIKVIFFLRLYQGLGQLVQMLATTIKELSNFTAFLFFSITFFAFSFRVLGTNFDATEYGHVQNFVVIFLSTYRNVIGDIQTPNYIRWSEDDISRFETDAIVGAIWLIWFMNSFINLIILLNFLIAVISQVYDNVIAEQQFCEYRYKSEFNREYFIILKFFRRVPDFKVLVQTNDITISKLESSDVYLGFVRTIKNAITETHANIKTELDKNTMKQQQMVILETSKLKKSFQMDVTGLKNEVKAQRKELLDIIEKIKAKI